MVSWEISFRVRHNYPFIKMSEKYHDARISMWCVWDREMIHVPINGEEIIREVEEYTTSIGRSIEEYRKSASGFVVTMKCTCDLSRNVWDLTGKNHCVDLHPAVFLNGWGYYRIMSFNEEDARKFFMDLISLGEFELISKRAIRIDTLPSTVWTESFFSKLTVKQMESLIKAYDHGYYMSPRTTSTESIASSTGVARSTYEEHLRKAENRIMDAIVPYLKLYAAGNPRKEDTVSPYTPMVEKQ